MASSYKEYLRTQHPERFSDSRQLTKAVLDPEALEFILSTLSAHNKEHEFERYCSEIIRLTITPNLIVQTGPTGGGDSKVDSETYPVDPELSELFPYSVSVQASEERWAFAYSVKQDWRAKFLSDVRKIKEVEDREHRGFTKVFFVSSQLISDKKRAEAEDEMRAETGLDVRIFDRLWLIEASLKTEVAKLATVRTLGLSDGFIQVSAAGERDSVRKNRLKAIDERLNAEASTLSSHEKLKLADEAAELACNLESHDDVILGYLDRHYRLAKKYGDKVEIDRTVYLCAYRAIAYCSAPDIQGFHERYEELEEIAQDERSKSNIENLITLWMLLSTFRNDGISESEIAKHAKVIQGLVSELDTDGNRRATAVDVSIKYLPMRLMLGEDPNTVLEDANRLLAESRKYIGSDCRMIIELLKIEGALEGCAQYEDVLDAAFERIKDDEGSSALAPMLFKRAESFEDKGQYYGAIRQYTHALACLHNRSDKENLVRGLVCLSRCCASVGLTLLARNASLIALNIGMDMYYGEATLTPLVVVACNYSKYFELRIGRIWAAVKLDTLEYYLKSLFANDLFEKDDLEYFDRAIAASILLTPSSQLVDFPGISEQLQEREYPRSAQMARFALGYVDEEALTELSCSEDDYTGYVRDFLKDAVDALGLPAETVLSCNEDVVLSTKLSGCTITVRTSQMWQCFETACTILAALEACFGTLLLRRFFFTREAINIDVRRAELEDKRPFTITHSGNTIIVRVGDLQGESYEVLANAVREMIAESIAKAAELGMPIDLGDGELIKFAEDDHIPERAFLYSASLTIVGNFVDTLPFALEAIEDYSGKFTYKRTVPFRKNEENYFDERQKGEPDVVYGRSPDGGLDLSKTNQKDVYISSLIDVDLWNRARWRGFGYVIQPTIPRPYLILMFEDKAGLKIFEDWRQQDWNVRNDLRIAIIKGIDSDRPLDYRAIVGTDCSAIVDKEATNSVYAAIVRMQTMQPISLDYLDAFEGSLNRAHEFVLIPGIVKGDNITCHWDQGITMGLNSIEIMYAHQIRKSDIFACSGLLPSDNPVIPESLEGSEVVEVIQSKRDTCGA